MSIKSIGATVICCALFSSTSALADDRYFGIGGGSFDIFENASEVAVTATLEGEKFTSFWDLRPTAQAIAISDSAYFIGIGAIKEFDIGENWALGIGFAPGFADEDDEKKALSYNVEFYSRLTVTYNANPDNRIRLELGHISNAGLSDTNPGTEPLMMSWLHRF